MSQTHTPTLMMPKANFQMSLFGAEIPEGLQKVQDQLNALDVNTLSPIEALLKLNELKRTLGNK